MHTDRQTDRPLDTQTAQTYGRARLESRAIRDEADQTLQTHWSFSTSASSSKFIASFTGLAGIVCPKQTQS